MVFGLGLNALPIVEHCPNAVNPFSSIWKRKILILNEQIILRSSSSVSFNKSYYKNLLFKSET